jgi:hypothetical protein
VTRKDPEVQRLIDSVAEQDCDTAEDVAMGLGYAIRESVGFPVPGRVLGEEVTVLGVEESDGLEVIALCERRGRRHRVRLEDIEFMTRPKGFEWVEASRQFRRQD